MADTERRLFLSRKNLWREKTAYLKSRLSDLGMNDELYSLLPLEDSDPVRRSSFDFCHSCMEAGNAREIEWGEEHALQTAAQHEADRLEPQDIYVFLQESEYTGALQMDLRDFLRHAVDLTSVYDEGAYAFDRACSNLLIVDVDINKSPRGYQTIAHGEAWEGLLSLR